MKTGDHLWLTAVYASDDDRVLCTLLVATYHSGGPGPEEWNANAIVSVYLTECGYRLPYRRANVRLGVPPDLPPACVTRLREDAFTCGNILTALWWH